MPFVFVAFRKCYKRETGPPNAESRPSEPSARHHWLIAALTKTSKWRSSTSCSFAVPLAAKQALKVASKGAWGLRRSADLK